MTIAVILAAHYGGLALGCGCGGGAKWSDFGNILFRGRAQKNLQMDYTWGLRQKIRIIQLNGISN